MKFTLAWLKEHLDTAAPLEAIVDKLTMIGLEVERVVDRRKLLAPFTIARVISAEQHPSADRLRVCMADTGSGDPVQVVCGAPNARAGMKGVFVPPGAFIPGKNITLGVGTIRGVESDLAAAGMGKLKSAPVTPVEGRFTCPVKVTLEFGSTTPLCRAFALRLVRNVKNGSSPQWLQRRLRAIGLRPINALVDITNFITYDRGRPLHVFDAAKVHGDLSVRRARNGESLLALDGKSYTLDDTMCVIADANGVESLAGIMGGEATGCSDATTDVLIESALWEPANIGLTGRKLGIHS